MRIPPIRFNTPDPTIEELQKMLDEQHHPPRPQPTFGYSHKLKTDFKKGRLPIKFDLAGFELNNKNVTLDHVQPKSLGGESALSNYVLNTARFNSLRGNQPMKDFITKEMFYKWAKQFEGLKVCGIEGLEYVTMIFKKIWG